MASIHSTHWKRIWPITRSAFLRVFSGVDDLPSRCVEGATMKLRSNRSSDRTLMNHMQIEEEPKPLKVSILAGGLGTRLTKETVLRAKPMVEIVDKPSISPL